MINIMGRIKLLMEKFVQCYFVLTNHRPTWTSFKDKKWQNVFVNFLSQYNLLQEKHGVS